MLNLLLYSRRLYYSNTLENVVITFFTFHQVFEELLLDQDWSLNAGNWMWLSASAFFHQFHRVYSPVVFGKKTDKLGDYIRYFLLF